MKETTLTHTVLIVLTATALLTACQPTTQRARGERDIAYKTAWFNNTPYSLTYHDGTVAYNVSVLSQTNYASATPNATLVDDRLVIDVVNAGGHPGVKPAYYTTPLTGNITAAEPPTTLRITDSASLNDDSVRLDWQQVTR